VEHDGRVNTSLGDPLPLFIRIRFDGRLWEAETQGETVQLRPEIGSPLTLPARMLQHLLTTGQAVEAKADTPSTITEEARELWLSAGPKQVERANQRLFTILAYVNGEPITFTPRAAQNWLKAFRQAEVKYGYGYLGLVDNFARRGNRGSRVETASKELLLAFLKNHYAVPQAKRASAVYALYREECLKQKIAPVSSATFYRERKRFTTPEVIATRRGKRAASQERPWFFSLDQTTPRHGERPFAIAHLDHTKLDIELVSSITGKPLARPWLTFLTDAYSRRILASHVSYEEPSYRSAMITFRLCVQRYGRLPQELVVDHGPDFDSVYFEALLAQCFITKVERPVAEPHAGAVIERLFGKTQVDFIQQLRGNTQATKVPRLLTREVDPKRLAVWTLERFTVQLREYVHEYYDQMEHSALFLSPREAYTQGMQLAGARSHRVIAYTDAFVMQTRPTTRTGAAKIHRSRGITVNGLQYWNERMHASDIAGHSVPVRFEPYDMGVIYAFIDGQWLECIADNYAQVHGRSEKEWELILEEWREHQRQHSQKRQTLNGPLLAQFLQQVEQEEKVALQHQRDHEEQALRLTSLQSQQVPIKPSEPQATIVIDFAHIPRFEEYR
jgi:putative transposase